MDSMEVDEVVDLSLGSRSESKISKPPNVSLGRSACNGWSSRRTLRPRTEMSYNELPDIVLLPQDVKSNGLPNGTCDDDAYKTTYFPPIKEMSPAETEEKRKLVRKLKNSLRNEEMLLVLFKKLRQSQQIKENVAVVTPQCNSNSSSSNSNNTSSTSVNTNLQSLPVVDKQTPPPRQSSKPILGQPVRTTIQPPRPAPPPRVSQPAQISTPALNRISSRPLPFNEKKEVERATESPAQRQAAAKLALRKQLEKTLLQIPPPKPPPPEMHFIPNPSNTEFIYLVGLEHVVDYITKDTLTPPPPEPFSCSQCNTSFTPVWKWEKAETKVICEQCVTSNVKKALKAEHTNRLKTAFVKALQQEQEIEQRLAQASPEPIAKPTPPPPPKPTPAPEKPTMRPHHPPPPLPAHVLPFSPLLYPYQLAMANAKNPSVNLSELQRQVVDIQRQYLLEMMPNRHSVTNWKI